MGLAVPEQHLCGAGGAYRNRYARDGVRRCQHVAAAIEDTPWINYHARGMNLSGNDAFRFNLNTPFGKNNTIEAPGNHYAVALNLSLDLRAFAQDDRLLRDDVSLDVAVNAKRTCDCERALKGHPLIDETCPLFAACALGC